MMGVGTRSAEDGPITLQEKERIMDVFDDLYANDNRELFDFPTEIGQWVSYAPYHAEEQLKLQKENLLPVGLKVLEGDLKLIYTKRMQTLSSYLEKVSKEIPIVNTEVILEDEVCYTSKIEGAKTTRIRTAQIHDGAPIQEDQRESELMVRNGFRAVKLVSLFSELNQAKLCKIWETLTEGCCQNESAKGKSGEYRKGDIYVSSHMGIPNEDLPSVMDLWLSCYNASHQDHLFIRAALLHYAFENIHPFCDGNGRMGRLLLNHYLIRNGIASARAVSFSMAIDKNRGAYDGAFVSSENPYADCTPFVEYMLEVFAEAYETAREPGDGGR